VNKIDCKSPAKINLFLSVKNKREDGFHEIATWMCAIDLCDDISITRSKNEYSTFKSEDTEIPFGKRNLCIKAFDIVRENTSMSAGDTVEIDIEKRIPLGSGFGGGSSNAASVINGLDKLFKLKLSHEEKIRLAAMVGSDVPFFIDSGNALATGRGEILRQLPPFPKPLWLVVAKPDFAISTGDAYKWIKDFKGAATPDPAELAAKIESGDVEYIISKTFNSFEPVVAEKHPVINVLLKKMAAAGCVKAQMSGSGSGLFGICKTESDARAAAKKLEGDDLLPFVAVCRTL
jgi:4-diphosphocytidyl-2-C-methyl-D-erythritol kinase